MSKLAMKLDETVSDSFFSDLEAILFEKGHEACSLDEFMSLEMDLYRRHGGADRGSQAGYGESLR